MRPGNEASAQRGRSFIEAARRAQIIGSAIATIADVGYNKASFARIAERAEISAGLISYHFRGKDELIEQVVAHVVAGMTAAIEERTKGATSYTGAFSALIEAQVGYFADHRAETLAVGSIYASTRNEVGPQNYAAVNQEHSLAQLEAFILEAQQAGEFREFPPRLLASALLAALEAVPRELFRRPGVEVDAAAYGRELATTFELAVRKPRRGRR